MLDSNARNMMTAVMLAIMLLLSPNPIFGELTELVHNPHPRKKDDGADAGDGSEGRGG